MKTVKIVYEECPHCAGKGNLTDEKGLAVCGQCLGLGEIMVQKVVKEEDAEQ
jgi:DnaJ-class molecular chaperone